MKIRNVAGPLLLVIPLILTGTIGVYFNNFNNNGFATPAVAGFNGCPTLIQWNDPTGLNGEICQAYNQTYTGPCQTPQNATYCGFQTASVLNPNSLYTCILTVSWQCFVAGITGSNNGPAPEPFAFFSGVPIFNVCNNYNSTGFIGSSVINGQSVMFQCDQITNSGHRVVANQSSEYQGQYNCTNFTKIGFGGNYVYFACNFIPSHTIPIAVNSTWSAILAFNSTQIDDGNGHGYIACIGNSFPYNLCDTQGSALIFTQVVNSSIPYHDVLDCPKWYASSIATSITPECHTWFNSIQQENGGTGGNIFFFSQILALIGGIILTLIGFGLGISGGAVTFNFSVTPNSQGTRYAQILGFALLVITPIDAEFAGPYTVLAVLGIGTIILGLFTLLEFFGIFFMVSQPIAG